jgi:hypothetical protein
MECLSKSEHFVILRQSGLSLRWIAGLASSRLKSLLEQLLHCRCVSLQVCVERLSLSPNLRLIRRTAKPFNSCKG